MSVIKEMIRLADSLDRKGLRKEADYLDRIINKVAQDMVRPGAATEQLRAGQAPTKTPSHVRSKVGPGMKFVKKNPGDPFDYIYNAAGDFFQVVSAPYQNRRALNAKITKSNNSKAYDTLMLLNPELEKSSPPSGAMLDTPTLERHEKEMRDRRMKAREEATKGIPQMHDLGTSDVETGFGSTSETDPDFYEFPTSSRS